MYFVTIVTQGQEALFGEVVEGEMRLNRLGEIVQKWWGFLPDHFPDIELGAFVIMPNHVHGIIILHGGRDTVPVPRNEDTLQFEKESRAGNTPGNMHGGGETPGGGTPPLQEPTLGQIVAYFKYQSTKEINALRGGPAAKIWQRNYYEHILRNQQDLELTWLYIESNPARWETDHENIAGK